MNVQMTSPKIRMLADVFGYWIIGIPVIVLFAASVIAELFFNLGLWPHIKELLGFLARGAAAIQLG